LQTAESPLHSAESPLHNAMGKEHGAMSNKHGAVSKGLCAMGIDDMNEMIASMCDERDEGTRVIGDLIKVECQFFR